MHQMRPQTSYRLYMALLLSALLTYGAAAADRDSGRASGFNAGAFTSQNSGGGGFEIAFPARGGGGVDVEAVEASAGPRRPSGSRVASQGKKPPHVEK